MIDRGDLKAFTNHPVQVRGRARAIGRELRRMLDPVVCEAVPLDMIDLLRAIDAKAERGTIRPFSNSPKEPR